MCGVCGIVGFRLPGAYDAEARVRSMMAALAHRGPDDAATGTSGGAVFGATRLAIRGGRDGRQPLADPATGVLVVCNGEIDNHRELRSWLAARGRPVAGRSDIAVLPGLYLELGESFVERLLGAFAVAVWDPREGRLLLARDRVGERPLFYLEHEGRAHFATVIAALAADPELPLGEEPEALRGYLRAGHFVAPGSPFAGVRKVCPGEVVVLESGGVERRRRYWRWPLGTAGKRAPATREFDTILRRAVLRQTEIDGGFGLFLSGGLDSSLLAAVVREVRPSERPPCYTLRFREKSYDEGVHAGEVARRLGLDLHEVSVEPEHFPENLPGLVSLVGEPLADPAWIPTALLARRAARDVKVALVGEGGDEVFGGYPTYLGAGLADGFRRLPSFLRTAVSTLLRAWPPSDRKVTLGFLLKRFVEGAGMEPLARHLFWISNIPPEILRRLGCASPAGRRPEPGGELLDLLQRIDLETSLAEGLLTKADRASMLSAVELRAPYLDADVLAFAATLPVAERVRGTRTKRFLKRFASRYLPGGIVHRRKRGLSVPLSPWLRGPLEPWARERLATGRADALGVRADVALDLLREHRERRADHARALWSLLVLDEWLAWAARRRAPRAGHSATSWSSER